MSDFKKIKNIADVPIEDYRRHLKYVEHIESIEASLMHLEINKRVCQREKMINIKEFKKENKGLYYQHISLLNTIEQEVKWATYHYQLYELEQLRYRQWYNFMLLDGAGWKPIKKKSGVFPNPELLNGLNWRCELSLIMTYRIFFNRMIEYCQLFLPLDYFDEAWILDNDTTYSDRVTHELHHINTIGFKSQEKLLGESISDYVKTNNRLLLFLGDANEVIIRKKKGIIESVRIVTGEIGSLRANESQLEMLNDLIKESNSFLCDIKEGGGFIRGDDIIVLKELWKEAMFFPEKGNQKFIFGRKRSSLKQDFAKSLRPLYAALKGRFETNNLYKFQDYTNRDYYRYIIDLLEIPISLATEENLEYHLK